jgi:antitoxin component YwqK of YwqJK toxin-antitoxin module
MKIIVFIFLYSTVVGCNNTKTRSIQLANQVAEGNISKDSTYEGLIKFYDKNNRQLLSEATYTNNVLEGYRVFYFPNGQKKVEMNYKSGEPLGFTKIYNKQGSLEKEQYFYYGLQVGSSIQYANETPKQYFFYSFDDALLFHLDYDSIGSKRIDELQEKFFFFRKKDLQLFDFKSNEHKVEYFIYLISPPKYKFTYSLCQIDSSFKVLETMQTFDSGRMWETFLVDPTKQTGETFLALRLRIEDQINGADMTTFKKL